MEKSVSLSPKHILLAFTIVVIWGLNFIAVVYGLKGMPPLLLCAIRFGLAAIPWVFIVPRPTAPMKLILGYGLFTFVLQFAFLFSGLYLGLSPGLSSLVLQVQVFFSMGLAAWFFKDRPGIWKVCGSLISFIGIGIVALHIGGGTTMTGLLFTLLAALCWASGNMFSKKIDSGSALSLVVWGNLVAFPFMVAFSLMYEGPVLISTSLHHISGTTILAIAYITYMSTHIGYGAWGFLLNNYSTANVVPFTLLIPVVSFISSAIILGEDLPSWKILASFFVLFGVAFNLLEKPIYAMISKVRSQQSNS